MPAAEADVEEAFAWYEAQRPGLGETFRRALDVAVASIEEHPAIRERGALVEGANNYGQGRPFLAIVA